MIGSPVSVLVVEDDKYISSAYKTKFEAEGFNSKVAYNGKEAISLLKVFHPDVIVLDLVMPRSDGFEVLDKLRKNTKWRQIPVIIASNLEEKTHIKKAQNFQANEYVFKSNLTLVDLVNRIKEIKQEQSS
jgi:DNA-binding response OmpR family regulator